MGTRRKNGGIEGTGIDTPVREKGKTLLDGANAEGFDVADVRPATEDQLGGAAADVHHQPLLVRLRESAGNAHVDQTTFLFTGNDFDRMADRLLGKRQEG